MALRKNDEIELIIDGLTSEGAAVGHYNGLAVFVRGGVPGDSLLVHIIKTAKRYAVGIIKEVRQPSPSRIESDCPAAAKCGGCSFRNMTYAEELRYKQSRVEEAVARIAHLSVPVQPIRGADKLDGYRNKAQYPVVIDDGALTAGFYAYKSHRIVPCGDCLLQPPVFRDCLQAFADWARQAEITSYDEHTGKGLLRHIYLRRAAATGEIMACAVINGDTLPQAEVLISALSKIDGMQSICINVNKEDSNVVLGNVTKALWGSETITDVLCGKRFAISPNAFYQVNHDQCEKLYRQAAEYAALTGQETLVDLYCGAGTIGLTMADKAKKLFGIEIVPQAIENAKHNAKQNGITNAEFFCGDAAAGAKELQRRGIQPDVVMLDPPRKGCSEELLHTVAAMQPLRIVYVSCDSATLARDLAILNEIGYSAREITPVDMFPRTPHVEAVALLEREDYDGGI